MRVLTRLLVRGGEVPAGQGGLMGRYLLARLAWAVPIVLAILIINFLIVHLVPGDPGAGAGRRFPDAAGIHRAGAAGVRAGPADHASARPLSVEPGPGQSRLFLRQPPAGARASFSIGRA